MLPTHDDGIAVASADVTIPPVKKQHRDAVPKSKSHSSSHVDRYHRGYEALFCLTGHVSQLQCRDTDSIPRLNAALHESKERVHDRVGVRLINSWWVA